jgi:hypothetical protein
MIIVIDVDIVYSYGTFFTRRQKNLDRIFSTKSATFHSLLKNAVTNGLYNKLKEYPKRNLSKKLKNLKKSKDLQPLNLRRDPSLTDTSILYTSCIRSYLWVPFVSSYISIVLFPILISLLLSLFFAAVVSG